MDLDLIAQRSYARVAQRVSDDSPLKGDDDSLLCPWCQRPMRVRFSTLGRIWTDENGNPSLVNGVAMKCAGDQGCGFRPDFDVPITKEVYDEEMDLRDGQTTVNMGVSAESEEEIEERLKDLGYIV